jgi:hypothetical protein
MYSFRDHSISSVEFDKSTPNKPSEVSKSDSLTVQIKYYACVRK